MCSRRSNDYNIVTKNLFETLHGPFSGCRATTRRKVNSTTKFPGIHSIHLMDLRKMKGWVDNVASSGFEQETFELVI